MNWGQQIGSKFDHSGKPMRYPGNTVICDLREDNPAYAPMDRLRQMLEKSALTGHFILLPRASYHMTVIRGLNDLVRTDDFWPDRLPKEASMHETDEYVTRAVASVSNPGSIHMRFDAVVFDDADVRVRLLPADEQQEASLTAYRNTVADALGLRLPGHDSYRYHLTLAYVLHQVPAHDMPALNLLHAKMDAVLSRQPVMRLDPPYMAYYRDMFAFYPHPIDRDSSGGSHGEA